MVLLLWDSDNPLLQFAIWISVLSMLLWVLYEYMVIIYNIYNIYIYTYTIPIYTLLDII